jgi:hypothetical protein
MTMGANTMPLAYVKDIHSGTIIRYGFGGPWMRGKTRGQLALFMIWEENWSYGDIVFARVLFSTDDWRFYWHKSLSFVGKLLKSFQHAP